jgi:hydroxymethylbilane synthase
LKPIRIVSRGSALARWQSRSVAELLGTRRDAPEVQLVEVQTTGDRITDVPLARIGGRGLFTKEVDDVLLRGEGELAVHSLKDLPTAIPEGLTIAAVLAREDPRDALLVAPGMPRRMARLAPGARVGTSSLRRRALLGSVRPDLRAVELRGNLDTRIERLERGDFEAILVAAAGVRRLGLGARIAESLSPPGWLPAVGQGALALVCRTDDDATLRLAATLAHPETERVTRAERGFLAHLEGGCQVPIAGLATLQEGRLRLLGCVASLDGTTLLRAGRTGGEGDPAALGREVAEELLRQGAAELLEEVRRQASGVATGPAAP